MTIALHKTYGLYWCVVAGFGSAHHGAINNTRLQFGAEKGEQGEWPAMTGGFTDVGLPLSTDEVLAISLLSLDLQVSFL